MELYYQGVNIADRVDVAECIHREASDGCDCLEIALEHAAAWYAWQPQVDDEIEAALDGYRTGRLFLNTILPQDGKYRILATGLPRAARRRIWASYEGIRLRELIASCASECGMQGALYGISDAIRYPYMLRKNEGPAAFMNRILSWEGAAFKAVSGRFAGISIADAQGKAAVQSIELHADQPGVTHVRRDDQRLAGLTLKTPYAECTAWDDAAGGGGYLTRTDIPAIDDAQAGRWARGMLLAHNRKAESLTIGGEFRPGLTAMARIDVISQTSMAGRWIVDAAEHDFIHGKSTATLLRCLESIR